MASPFDGAWLKWGRGVVHAQSLEREIAAEMQDFQAGKSFTSRTEYSAKSHCVRLVVESIDPLTPRLGLLVGDTANNFRAALDHLAWALVTTRGKRRVLDKETRHIYFPIALDRDRFNSHLVVSEFLRPTDRAIIRRYQPYVRGQSSTPFHCLTPLPQLNADDKHRLIRAVWAWPTGGNLYTGDPVDCTVTRIPTRARGIVLEPGAEIHRVYVRRTGPKPDLYMEAELTVYPTLDGRVQLGDWLAQTTAHIRDLLREFAEPPEEITTLGIVPMAHADHSA